jgi:hypothetical protein
MLLNETLFARYGGWLPENPVIYGIIKELCCDVKQSAYQSRPHAPAVAGLGKVVRADNELLDLLHHAIIESSPKCLVGCFVTISSTLTYDVILKDSRS